MSAINTVAFRGELPRVSPQLLPDNCAQSAINVRLLDGNLVPLKKPTTEHTFTGGPFKSIYEMEGISKWLRWEKIVDVAASVGLGDTTNRIYFTTYGGTGTGLDSPRVTNAWLATDPSNQGANPADGYPYKSQPLGSPNPLNPPVVSTAPPVGVTTEYDYAAEASVNSAVIVVGGTGYVVGDRLQLNGGTAVDMLPSTASAHAQVQVESIDSVGAVTGVSLVKGGFYTAGNAPTGTVTSTQVPRANGTTGVGTGATFGPTTVPQSFDGFTATNFDFSANSYIHWTLTSNRWQVAAGQGDLTSAVSSQSYALSNAARFVFQADMTDSVEADANKSDLVMYLAGSYNGTRQIVGPAVVLSFIDHTFTLYSSMAGANGQAVTGTIVQQVAYTPDPTKTYRMTATCTANIAATIPGFDVVVTLVDVAATGTILATVLGFIPNSGENIGVGQNHRWSDNTGGDSAFENLMVMVSTNPDPSTLEATEYCFTYLSVIPDGGTGTAMESGPSPVSALIDVANTDSRSVTVMLPAVPQANEQTTYGATYDTDYNITLRRLYRTLTGPSGTTFNLVAELPIATTAYVDTVADADLGVELPSEGWDLPPADGHSIINLPNGITAIASKNQLYLSAIGHPHAFVLANRLPTDTLVVALGAIDTTLIVLTEGFPYIASGTDPSNYGMGKLERSYGCTSHRSVAYLRQFGIVWSSTEGFIACNGAGLRNITEQYYSKQDWDAFKRFWTFLAPTTFVSSTVDDRYISFCQPTDGTIRGIIFDPKEAGHAWTWFDFSTGLDYTATPADGYYTTKTGALYMARGSNRDLFDSGNPLTYTWLSKVFRQAFPTTFILGRVKPSSGYNSSTTPVTVEFIADAVSIGTYTVLDRLPFTIGEHCAEDISYKIVGVYPVEGVGFAEHPEGLL